MKRMILILLTFPAISFQQKTLASEPRAKPTVIERTLGGDSPFPFSEDFLPDPTSHWRSKEGRVRLAVIPGRGQTQRVYLTDAEDKLVAEGFVRCFGNEWRGQILTSEGIRPLIIKKRALFSRRLMMRINQEQSELEQDESFLLDYKDRLPK